MPWGYHAKTGSFTPTEEVRAMMNAQAQTRRTMSNALALLEDVVESIDGTTKERLSQTIEELEAIENELGGERR